MDSLRNIYRFIIIRIRSPVLNIFTQIRNIFRKLELVIDEERKILLEKDPVNWMEEMALPNPYHQLIHQHNKDECRIKPHKVYIGNERCLVGKINFKRNKLEIFQLQSQWRSHERITIDYGIISQTFSCVRNKLTSLILIKQSEQGTKTINKLLGFHGGAFYDSKDYIAVIFRFGDQTLRNNLNALLHQGTKFQELGNSEISSIFAPQHRFILMNREFNLFEMLEFDPTLNIL